MNKKAIADTLSEKITWGIVFAILFIALILLLKRVFPF